MSKSPVSMTNEVKLAKIRVLLENSTHAKGTGSFKLKLCEITPNMPT